MVNRSYLAKLNGRKSLNKISPGVTKVSGMARCGLHMIRHNSHLNPSNIDGFMSESNLAFASQWRKSLFFGRNFKTNYAIFIFVFVISCLVSKLPSC